MGVSSTVTRALLNCKVIPDPASIPALTHQLMRLRRNLGINLFTLKGSD